MMETPTEESLQQMSHSELKRYAKTCGIKGNKKAKSLIASILERTRSDEDSFVTMEQKIINSCKKNKLEEFDKNKEVASDTPRRETYVIDCPLDVSLALNNDLITSSASPVLKTTPVENETSLNVTMTRGSEKKSKRKVSFVTPIRRSARLSTLTPHYASIKGRPKTPIPSKNSSGHKREPLSSKENKMFSGSLYITDSARKSSEGGKERRPSTPMPKTKFKRMNLNSTGLATPIATPVSTPDASSVTLSKQKRSVKFILGHEESIATPNLISTPEVVSELQISKKKSAVKLTPASVIKSALTPGVVSITKVKRSATQNSAVEKAVEVCPLSNIQSKTSFTPKSKPATTPASSSVTKVKRSATPNFAKLHQKAFDKMESIDEYTKRKQLNSAKKIEEHLKFHDPSKPESSKKVAPKKNSRIQTKFNGIPFIPSVTSTKAMKTNFAFSDSRTRQAKKMTAVKFASRNESSLSKNNKLVIQGGAKLLKPVLQENTPLKKCRFDLKASLSKKLPYKPHAGPLKPLGEINLNSTIHSSTGPPPQRKAVIENKVIKAKRTESRGVLRGVRQNRRFELQMKNRKVALA